MVNLAWLEQTMSWLIESYGILGIFIVSLVGNSIPYSTIPYLILIALYSATLPLEKQIMVILAGGLGAAIGKVIVLMLGKAARTVLSEEAKENLEVFLRLSRRSMLFAIFIFAALPLPDDILYMPLGVSGYSTTRFFLSVLAGKIVITWLTVGFSDIIVAPFISFPLWIQVVVLLIITVILTYIIIKIRWIRIVKSYQDGGILSSIGTFLEELANIFKIK